LNFKYSAKCKREEEERENIELDSGFTQKRFFKLEDFEESELSNSQMFNCEDLMCINTML
jgi:hypothetical protein